MGSFAVFFSQEIYEPQCSASCTLGIKAHTTTPTFAESPLESADSSSELADSNADTPVGM